MSWKLLKCWSWMELQNWVVIATSDSYEQSIVDIKIWIIAASNAQKKQKTKQNIASFYWLILSTFEETSNQILPCKCGPTQLWAGQESADRVKKNKKHKRKTQRERQMCGKMGRQVQRPKCSHFLFISLPQHAVLPWTPPPSEPMALSQAKTYRSLCEFGEGKHRWRSRSQCGCDLCIASWTSIYWRFGIEVSDRTINPHANAFCFEGEDIHIPHRTGQVRCHFSLTQKSMTNTDVKKTAAARGNCGTFKYCVKPAQSRWTCVGKNLLQQILLTKNLM